MPLTMIVLVSIPIYVAIALLIRPMLLEHTKERFNTGAASQQFLVESVVGIQTLKAAAVEPMLRNQWEEKLAAYVKDSFKAVMLGNSVRTSSSMSARSRPPLCCSSAPSVIEAS